MSKERPLILATCDDGIESPGLRAAVRAVLDLGDVIVSAPCEQQSGAGRSLPTFNDGAIHVIDYSVDHQQVPAYAIHGSPAQAVLYALVDVPCDATPDTPWQITRTSRQRYFLPLPSGRRYLTEKRRPDYEIAVDRDTLEPNSDIQAIYVDRAVSVTPLSLDLTARTAFAELGRLLR